MGDVRILLVREVRLCRIVFDETRPNINYWEPWYLGWDASRQRERGVPSDTRPRTGPYKTMIETGRDLHELHALMAPRPFLVSGGAEDPPERWQALNHTVAVNSLPGYGNRIAMTNRDTHDPTPQSNGQLYAFFEHFLKSTAPAGSDCLSVHGPDMPATVVYGVRQLLMM